MDESHNKEQCVMCRGTGNHYHPQPKGVIGYLPCNTCNGTGEITPILEQVKELKPS